MNPSQIRAILRLEWISMLCMAIFSIPFLGIAIWWMGTRDQSGFSFSPVDSFTASQMFFGAVLLYPGVLPASIKGILQSNGVEFSFSQPLSRCRMFWIKSGIYLLGCLMAPAILWLYSFSLPPIEIRLAYQPEDRKATEQFYSQAFDEVETKKTKNGDVLIVPQGQVYRSLFRIFATMACVLLMQTVAVFTMETRWGGYLLSLVWFFWPACFGALSFGRGTPSFYESGVALTAHHATLIAFSLGLVFLGVQMICVRRFCRTEVM